MYPVLSASNRYLTIITHVFMPSTWHPDKGLDKDVCTNSANQRDNTKALYIRTPLYIKTNVALIVTAFFIIIIFYRSKPTIVLSYGIYALTTQTHGTDTHAHTHAPARTHLQTDRQT